MSLNLDNYKKITGCPNGYNKDSFTSSFFVNEKESEVCENCNNFCFKDGIATCKLITGIFESETADDFNSTMMEKL